MSENIWLKGDIAVTRKGPDKVRTFTKTYGSAMVDFKLTKRRFTVEIVNTTFCRNHLAVVLHQGLKQVYKDYKGIELDARRPNLPFKFKNFGKIIDDFTPVMRGYELSMSPLASPYILRALTGTRKNGEEYYKHPWWTDMMDKAFEAGLAIPPLKTAWCMSAQQLYGMLDLDSVSRTWQNGPPTITYGDNWRIQSATNQSLTPDKTFPPITLLKESPEKNRN